MYIRMKRKDIYRIDLCGAAAGASLDGGSLWLMSFEI
jgi:hypothetical protein